MRTPPVLSEVPIEANEETVDMLERALVAARAGDLTNVAICGTVRGNQVWLSSSFDDGLLLIGALEHAKARMTIAMTGGGDE